MSRKENGEQQSRRSNHKSPTLTGIAELSFHTCRTLISTSSSDKTINSVACLRLENLQSESILKFL